MAVSRTPCWYAWTAVAVPKIAAANSVAATTAVTALCRLVHFLIRTSGPARFARIGSSARNRLRSSASSWAVA